MVGSEGGKQPCEQVLVEDLNILLLQTTPAGKEGRGGERRGGAQKVVEYGCDCCLPN